jgi:copper chaperone
MTATTPGSSELRFDVDGMTCAHCQRAIGDEVGRIAAVTDVDVDLDEALVTVHGTDLVEQVVLDAIMLAGYTARPA